MNFRHLILTGAIALPTALVMPASPSAARLESAEMQGIEQQAEPARIAEVPPAPWADLDPADSLYRAGREALNREDFRRAAALFAEISRRFPKSEYAADAGYWRAYALYRSGRDSDHAGPSANSTVLSSANPAAAPTTDIDGCTTMSMPKVMMLDNHAASAAVVHQLASKPHAAPTTDNVSPSTRSC